MAVQLQATSRESLAAARQRLEARTDAPGTDAAGLGVDLFAVARLLHGQRPLRRLLGEGSTPAPSRIELLDRVLGGRLRPASLEVARELVGARWSQSLDLVDVVELLARDATLAVAEAEGSLDDVEDELFRFGRILDRELELAELLADTGRPEAGRLALLDGVLAGRVSPVTSTLLHESVRLPRGRHLDVLAEQLAELAAARRQRSVARVTTPVALAPPQEERLLATLGRLYGRPMSLQIELDPSLLGGLVVQVGGEVIDGSVAGKLATARRVLPS